MTGWRSQDGIDSWKIFSLFLFHTYSLNWPSHTFPSTPMYIIRTTMEKRLIVSSSTHTYPRARPFTFFLWKVKAPFSSFRNFCFSKKNYLKKLEAKQLTLSLLIREIKRKREKIVVNSHHKKLIIRMKLSKPLSFHTHHHHSPLRPPLHHIR